MRTALSWCCCAGSGVGPKTGDHEPTQVTDKPGGLRGPAVPRDFLPEVTNLSDLSFGFKNFTGHLE